MTARDDFWSRRRAAVAAEKDAERTAELEKAEAATRAELEEMADDQILEELGLPDPETLKPGDDVAGFMAQAVPDRLRRRALRQLWKLNPVLANVDGLVDYGEDFTDSAKVVEDLQTAYQVGKGMRAHVEELARQAEARLEDDNAETQSQPEPDPAQPPETSAMTDETRAVDPPALPRISAQETNDNGQDTTKVAVVPTPDSAQSEIDMSASAQAPLPRRMRFEFEG
ncbi:DUF3306 domain-containing protein [Primorskyibacter sp. S87]|uniref:DUF3306 domain-containing protein n=1 Tax=Primorskyibacter sp. S87 TaxID=3415126 RepID=UPI003C7D46D3